MDGEAGLPADSLCMRAATLRGMILVLTLVSATALARAERGILVVHVKDVQSHPIESLGIGTEGEGDTANTDVSGLARLRLAPQTRAKTWLSLQLVHAPRGKDFVMISPWNGRTLVPPFENESENFVDVVVAERGDRAILESGTALSAIVSKILEGKVTKPRDERGNAAQQRQAALGQAADALGLSARDLDDAIRAWGKRAKDPYEAGLAALYARDYPRATRELSGSLELRRKEAETAESDAANAALYLGVALHEQGKYRDSIEAYKQADKFRPDDPTILNNLGVSLLGASDFEAAETTLQKALGIRERDLGIESIDVAETLDNIGILLNAKGEYTTAEPLLRRALAIRETVLPPGHPDIAYSSVLLAIVLEELGDFVTAESLLRRALGIREKALPDSPDVAQSLNDLGRLLERKGDYAAAVPLFTQAIAIVEKDSGPKACSWRWHWTTKGSP